MPHPFHDLRRLFEIFDDVTATPSPYHTTSAFLGLHGLAGLTGLPGLPRLAGLTGLPRLAVFNDDKLVLGTHQRVTNYGWELVKDDEYGNGAYNRSHVYYLYMYMHYVDM